MYTGADLIHAPLRIGVVMAVLENTLHAVAHRWRVHMRYWHRLSHLR